MANGDDGDGHRAHGQRRHRTVERRGESAATPLWVRERGETREGERIERQRGTIGEVEPEGASAPAGPDIEDDHKAAGVAGQPAGQKRPSGALGRPGRGPSKAAHRAQHGHRAQGKFPAIHRRSGQRPGVPVGAGLQQQCQPRHRDPELAGPGQDPTTDFATRSHQITLGKRADRLSPPAGRVTAGRSGHHRWPGHRTLAGSPHAGEWALRLATGSQTSRTESVSTYECRLVGFAARTACPLAGRPRRRGVPHACRRDPGATVVGFARC